ncbi:MAG: hypothetical protein JRE61_16550 [Deltaproteobacteria bacterium]|nr:hypothetical protein [Deltaproteobacteria bacterium]
MKKHYLTAFLIVMISALLISCGGKKVMETAPSFELYKFNANQYVPKVDNFMVILDTSSSMAKKYNQKKKANIAKDFLNLAIVPVCLTSRPCLSTDRRNIQVQDLERL